jgi:hypothetical protein
LMTACKVGLQHNAAIFVHSRCSYYCNAVVMGYNCSARQVDPDAPLKELTPQALLR